ncbi:chitinase 2-like [Vicia villosa]|uniref:chitinase 2-like n=1 Tax=Vicia villosa TaxID=3911 RepID=UPI00273BA499|nr:chitinase 2-like [Vicia villosa]
MSANDSNGNIDLTIYRLYMLHLPNKLNFNAKLENFDYILGFASEDYIQGKGTGNFNPTWNLNDLSPENVKSFKDNNPQVRVVISIGGVGDEYPFNPFDKNTWITYAVNSIKQIIVRYDQIHKYENLIDGIDIHYDVVESNEDDFSYCVGEVIKQLKNDTPLSINVVSIAPTKKVESYYEKLYLDNKDMIDLVDYQFYNQEFSSEDEVVELYKKLVVTYSPCKVLPGYTNPPDPILMDGIMYLIKNKLVPGVFVWNTGSNSFFIENMLLAVQES